MKKFTEFLAEARQEFTDFDAWKKAVLAKNPKADFTEEGHGGSEFVIGSTKGSPQQTGKWMGKATAKRGKGYVY